VSFRLFAPAMGKETLMRQVEAGKHYDGYRGELYLRTARKDRHCMGNGAYREEYFRKSTRCAETIRKGDVYVEVILKRYPGRMPDSVKRCIACAAAFDHISEPAAKEGQL